MATLYWGGGTGTWDGFTTTNWYTDLARTVASTRAPSAEDDVVFDSSSNATAYTVTISNSTTVCKSCTISGPATGNVTIAGTGTWYIYGNLTLPATGITRTFTGAIQFWATSSITTNGVTLASAITVAAGTATLQDALNNGTSNITVTGTLNTNGKTVTCGSILGTGTLTLGASTVTATTIGATGALTVNGGTSSITLSSATAGIGGGTGFTGGTFYDVTFSSTAITTANIYGNNTFNNLTFATKATTTVSTVVVYGNQTVNGTLTISGASAPSRYALRTNTNGTTRTITVAAVSTLTDVDFGDITVAGASSPWSGTRLGDAGGNTNITFPAAKTVYWNQVAGGSWTDAAWATGSGGTASINNFPLAQDSVIIDDTGLNTGTTISVPAQLYYVTSVTSTKTNAFTFSIATGGQLRLLGDLTLTASITVNGTFSFNGRATQNFTSAGNTIRNVVFNSVGSVVKLQDAVSSNSTWTFTQGGLDTNGYTVTQSQAWTFSTVNNGPLTLSFGASSITTPSISSSFSSASTITLNAGTSSISISSNNPSIGFVGQTLTWYNVTFTNGTNAGANVYGTNTFNNLTLNAAGSTTGVNTYTVGGNVTVSGTLALVGGASATQRRGIFSDTPGTQRTLTAATVTGLTDIDFRDINGAGAGTWTGGTRIGDCGGNAGIGFTAARTVYWNLAGTNNWQATGWATGSGGTPAANNFPLAQDTCVFDDTGAAGTVTLNASYNIGTIDASARTSAMTLSSASSNIPIWFCGDITLGSGVTTSAGGTPYKTWTFIKPSTQTLTMAGELLPANMVIDNPSCSVVQADALTILGNFTVTRGSFDTQSYALTTPTISSSNANTRSITLGSSTVTCTSTLPITFTNPTNLTFSGASSTINLSSTSVKTFAGGGKTFGTVSSTGGTTNPLTITGSNTFTTLTNSAYTYLVFESGSTQTITNFTYSGASGSQVRWYSNTPGQRAFISTASYAVGANSVDGGNNSGLTFTGSSPDYFYVKDISSPVTSIDVTVTESGTGADTVVTVFVPSASVAETASGADATLSLISAQSSIAETGTAADTIVAGNVFLSDITESSGSADLITAAFAFSGTITESASGADVTLSVQAILSAVDETASGADAFASVLFLGPSVSETASGADATAGVRVAVAVVDETAVGTDDIAPESFLVPQVFETASGADAVLTIATLSPTIDEFAVIADVVLCRFPWTVIDDLQDPNWQVITTPPEAAWSNINTDQGPDWTLIQT